MAAIAITIIITVGVATITDSLRQYLFFDWKVEENDQFVYNVSVVGYRESGHFFYPIPQAVLNNSYILIELVTLPNKSIILSGNQFSEQIIEYMKTDVVFENGTEIPLTLYSELDTVCSRCFLPVGPWPILDSFYPDTIPEFVNQTIESYLSRSLREEFSVGHYSYEDQRGYVWLTITSTITGVPSVMTYSAWNFSGLVKYFYNVTMSLIDCN